MLTDEMIDRQHWESLSWPQKVESKLRSFFGFQQNLAAIPDYRLFWRSDNDLKRLISSGRTVLLMLMTPGNPYSEAVANTSRRLAFRLRSPEEQAASQEIAFLCVDCSRFTDFCRSRGMGDSNKVELIQPRPIESATHSSRRFAVTISTIEYDLVSEFGLISALRRFGVFDPLTSQFAHPVAREKAQRQAHMLSILDDYEAENASSDVTAPEAVPESATMSAGAPATPETPA
ncbi:hypothetical protein H696_02157 [Fonticula alba]|uniref:Uncharacterized protein n=1 Tax=Fonticula alba TaxID=691883 RepID=A0A058ZB97_FONAL|nr:hypothetical protein H696_02157 [Fonticula alba]KCV71206.1 hypothetical protein H696_02157 [Fonticula alba]|eukprot:XP_009494329.1 hypothetical protein H696_02157 [Fonticula alba]